MAPEVEGWVEGQRKEGKEGRCPWLREARLAAVSTMQSIPERTATAQTGPARVRVVLGRSSFGMESECLAGEQQGGVEEMQNAGGLGSGRLELSGILPPDQQAPSTSPFRRGLEEGVQTSTGSGCFMRDSRLLTFACSHLRPLWPATPATPPWLPNVICV